jgi:hypothetical protein
MPDSLFILVDSTIFFSVCGNDLNEVEVLIHNIFNNMTKIYDETLDIERYNIVPRKAIAIAIIKARRFLFQDIVFRFLNMILY